MPGDFVKDTKLADESTLPGGNVVRGTETDANGNPLFVETDINGNPITTAHGQTVSEETARAIRARQGGILTDTGGVVPPGAAGLTAHPPAFTPTPGARAGRPQVEVYVHACTCGETRLGEIVG